MYLVNVNLDCCTGCGECVGCMSCVEVCPDKCIEVREM